MTTTCTTRVTSTTSSTHGVALRRGGHGLAPAAATKSALRRAAHHVVSTDVAPTLKAPPSPTATNARPYSPAAPPAPTSAGPRDAARAGQLAHYVVRAQLPVHGRPP